jgi:hypothetical protein
MFRTLTVHFKCNVICPSSLQFTPMYLKPIVSKMQTTKWNFDISHVGPLHFKYK